MKRCAALLLVVSWLGAGGCFKATYVAPSRTPAETSVDKKMPFFLLGLVGTGQVDTRELCPVSGPASITTKQTFVDMLLAAVTFGIYTPRTAVVRCAR